MRGSLERRCFQEHVGRQREAAPQIRLTIVGPRMDAFVSLASQKPAPTVDAFRQANPDTHAVGGNSEACFCSWSARSADADPGVPRRCSRAERAQDVW